MGRPQAQPFEFHLGVGCARLVPAVWVHRFFKVRDSLLMEKLRSNFLSVMKNNLTGYSCDYCLCKALIRAAVKGPH